MNRFLHRVQTDFTNAASTYDLHAQLQREVVETLFQFSSLSAHTDMIADLGCGTGYLARHLAHIQKNNVILQVDLAEAMCREAHRKGPAVCADMHALPFGDGSVPHLFSSLALQWAEDPFACLREFARVVAPDGTIAFSTLLPGTLHELQSSFDAAGDGQRLHAFRSREIWESLCLSAGLEILDAQEDDRRCEFPSPEAVIGHLKGLGAARKRDIAPLSPRRYRNMLEHYRSHYPSAEGVEATFRVLLVLARRT